MVSDGSQDFAMHGAIMLLGYLTQGFKERNFDADRE